MPVTDAASRFGDVGLFQDAACPPPSAPSPIRAALTPPPSSVAPPPPPPAPPPPPPAPPLLPGPGDPSTGLLRHMSVRKLFWKTIPEHQVKAHPNVWTRGPAEQHQIDAHAIEELFGHGNCQSNSKTPPTRGGRVRTFFRDAKDEVCLLDGKRSLNVGIFLKQFKRSSESIVDDVRRGNGEIYGSEPLRELLKLLPEPEEVQKLRSFRGDVAKLSLADSFVYLLIQLPSYVVRIESMLLKEEFPSESEAMKHDIWTLRSAIRELLSCEELHAVLHLVLQAGNLLNAGGYSGNAAGFKLSSLPTLAETKSNKPGMNLLHFVALEAQKKDEKLLEFPLKLPHVQAASRISLEVLDSELQSLVSRIRSIEENAERDTDLIQQLHDFLQSSSSALASLRASRLELRSESEELLDFFCEDRDSFRLDDCFSIFSSFCLRFTAAVKENAERQRKEAARRRRLQQLEEQKRHSWAAGEQFAGAFGLRSSSELDVTSALSRSDEADLLMELLMPKPRSPLLRRSGSFRRTRNPTEDAVRASELKRAEKTDGSASPRVANEQTPQKVLNTATENLGIDAKQANTDGAASDLNNNGNEQRTDRANRKDELKTDTKLTSSTSNMLVTVEKHALVPELKTFDKVNAPTTSKTQNDVTVLDLDEQNLEKSPEKVEFAVKTKDDTVIVWCVTGVCEVEDAQNDNQNVTSLNAVPISSQPVPSTRLGDITTVALQAGKESAEFGRGDVSTNQNAGEEEESTDQERVFESKATNGKQESQRDLVKEEVVRQEVTKTRRDSKVDPNVRQEDEVTGKRKGDEILEKVKNTKTGQTNTKVSPNAKTDQVAKKSPSPKTSPGRKEIRTLTATENHSMRRVVPISRPNSTKAPEKLSGRGVSSLSVPSRSSSQRGERPSTAPSSRRSSLNRADHDLDLTRKTAAKKTHEAKKLQQEEKICKSTLRSMNQKEERGVSSAPVTPHHKATPGFARNTASSSFRRTNTSFSKNPVSSNAASSQNSAQLTPKTSPKVSSPKLSQKSPSPTPRQNVASVQNDVNSLSKTSKISSAKSPSSANPTGREAKMNPKVLAQKTSPSSSVTAQKSTTDSSDNSNSKITSASKDQQDSETFKSKKFTAEISKTSPDPPSDLANNNNANVETSKSQQETDENASKLEVELLKNAIQKSQVSADINEEFSEMFSGNESLNLLNNNLDQTSAQTTSPQMSPLTKTPTGDSPSHDEGFGDGVKTSNLSNLEHLSKQKNPSSAQNSNLTSPGKFLSSRAKIPSPKAAPRSSSASFPSRQSPNQNSDPSPKPSFRVPSSSPKSPDFGLKSAKAAPRSPPLSAAPGGRRRNDSGNFSDKTSPSAKDSSRPTWR